MLYRYQFKLADIEMALPGAITPFLNNENLEFRLRTQASYETQHEILKEKMEEVRQECAVLIPETVDYWKMDLSLECKEKLEQWRPQNLAAASRIPGITPEALIALLRHIKQNKQLS